MGSVSRNPRHEIRGACCVSCQTRYGRRVPTVTDTPPDADASLRAAIRDTIKRAKRRQTDVAAAIGLSWPQWSRRMSPANSRNRVPWSIDELRQLADLLGVTLADLLGEDYDR